MLGQQFIAFLSEYEEKSTQKKKKRKENPAISHAYVDRIEEKKNLFSSNKKINFVNFFTIECCSSINREQYFNGHPRDVSETEMNTFDASYIP